MTNIFKKQYLILGCVALLVIILAWAGIVITRLWTMHSTSRALRLERMEKLHSLLCEDVKPGMSKNEVLNILGQIGDMAVAGDDSGPIMNLRIVFRDPHLNEIYGDFHVVFSDYKYVGAYVQIGFEQIETVCSFQ